MRMPDVNVLVYAHRADAPEHSTYKAWLDEVAAGPEPFALSALVAVGFLRVATNRRLQPEPSPITAALAFLDEIVARPTCRVVVPRDGHLGEVIRLCRATGTTGSSVADAQHAAVAISNGCTWVTADRGFAKFAAHALR